MERETLKETAEMVTMDRQPSREEGLLRFAGDALWLGSLENAILTPKLAC